MEGCRRPRIYGKVLDRVFNPKNGLSLAFFKKLTIAKNFIKPPNVILLYSSSLQQNSMVNFFNSWSKKFAAALASVHYAFLKVNFITF